MELDDLKRQWQQENTDLPSKNSAAIEQLLSRKTSDLVSTMKRRYEKIITMALISMLLLIVVFSIISDGFSWPGAASGFAKAMFFYGLLILFYWLKFRTVLHLTLSDHLQERMTQLVNILQKSRRIELIFSCIFFISLFTAGRFFFGKGLTGLFTLQMAALFLLAIVFAASMIWLIGYRHNQYIKELREYLKEYEAA